MVERGKVVKTVAAKQERLDACDRYEEYLYLIYHVGKGYMNANQLIEIMQFYSNKTRTNIWKAIRALEKKHIIDIVSKSNNQHLIILKKIALMYLLKTNSSTNMDSLEAPSQSSYIASVMRVQAIINTLHLIEADNTAELIQWLYSNTTYITRAKHGHIFLKKQKHIKNTRIDEEIELLKKIHQSNFKKLEVKSQFNLNSLQTRGLYIAKFEPREVILTWGISGGYLSERRCTDTIRAAVGYLQELMDIRDFRNIKITFQIYTLDEDKLLNTRKTLEKALKHQKLRYRDNDFLYESMEEYTKALKNTAIC